MLAQRYPNAYDGIAAAAPAIHWSEFIASTSWAQVTMNSLGEFPYPCELDAITTAAITHCDGLDGVEDGLVSDADRCDFNPHTLVGKVINCTQTGKRLKISPGAATIAKLTWDGPSAPDGTRLWYGPESQSRLTGDTTTEATTSDLGFAMTDCANGTCKGVPTGLGEPWLKYWVNKDPEWNYTLIKTVEDYERYFHSSVQEFNSIIGTSDPDLTRFRDAGGKLITYHGLVSEFLTGLCNVQTDQRRRMVSFLRGALRTITTLSAKLPLMFTIIIVTSRFLVLRTAQGVKGASLPRPSKR